MSATNKSIFITGANGYIAKHIIKQALANGYSVVGTVRSAEKGEALAKLVNSDKFSYEVVEGVDHKGAYDQPLKNHPEVSVLLHTASPVNYYATDPLNETILPAINGVKELFDSIKANAAQIEKVVLTTSVMAIAKIVNFQIIGVNHTEADWSPITIEEGKTDGALAYAASKKFEEQAAWKYVEVEKRNFTLTTVAPTFAVGPQAYDEDASAPASTSGMIAGLLSLTPSGYVYPFAGNFVDVRDVAKAHILGFELDDAQGKRLIAGGENFNFHKTIEVIQKHFPDYKGKLPAVDSTQMPPETPFINNKKTNDTLGFEFIDIESSIIDQLNQFFSAGK
ncbi:hypothetical protein CANARDRAFT_6629 [[Candida] arabinofermentans NRRL YB-2248]|uniref:NAD-dependent epimerase/dehydratase domain-containing protein n=1 Tax=[Candida] arabinofermentans NRRL YB-2248 TaxID=983967 RepID=A0A1E4T310_9ASCO|nr:hypothetical protein CANARDRAFT_6629 [[Candida] arabinofermentans NRRL YB-2248]